jgi:Protein of unknown function (DUF3073)
MGRGRAKAKQTKVARELKYSSQGTDFDALQRELSGSGSSNGGAQHHEPDADETDDYDDWAAEGR